MSRLKSAIKNRKYTFFRAQLSLRGHLGESVAYRVYRATTDINYFFHVFPDRKLIYVEVPKAGCTTIKRLLSVCAYGINHDDDPEAYHSRRQSGLLAPSDVGVRLFESLLRDPETLIFSVVRNPFSRLRSCYLNKFYDLKLSDPGNTGLIEQLMGDIQSLPSSDIDRDQLSFDSFVKGACTTAALGKNGHWSLMSAIIPDSSDLRIEIIKLESLAEGLDPVLARLGASEEIRSSLAKPLNQSAPKPGIKWTRPLAEAVRRAYAEDFRRFGYDSDYRAA
ncbi:sulfotransferase family protein [Mesorhizobium sp. CU2]|uniref:sulfotransferase family 2 domain-containing protein n=1 Tax=unclassified Mesorhizobium TaxID=325217 RepID=UPI00112B23F6|nr:MULTISPECIES: sulfotransferase family 2 domain-containing protein [unclassified Mesorhizobium]TPN76145.1 sulfotransferase family protein [Mesorhizobium sp. CU3]TPO10738.1 sulfotransferase family protein [Mesorhizobium sp. CU2]